MLNVNLHVEYSTDHPLIIAPYASLRFNHFRQRVFIVSGPAVDRALRLAVVRRRTIDLDDLHVVLSAFAARRLHILAPDKHPAQRSGSGRNSPSDSPYRLYSLSNVGCLLALLSYPFVFEPWMRLNQQAFTWTAAYLAFACFVT